MNKKLTSSHPGLWPLVPEQFKVNQPQTFAPFVPDVLGPSLTLYVD